MTPVSWRDHPEMEEFMRAAIPGRSEAEVRAAFLGKFGIELTRGQVKNFKSSRGLRSGTVGGRFEPGHASWNRGRPQAEWMAPEAVERTRATRFHAGDEPHNGARVPVGTERLSKDGYVEVKCHRLSPKGPCSNNCWRPKGRVVWEQEHGRPFPAGHKCVFANGDRLDFSPGNVVAVPEGTWSVICRMHWEYHDADTLGVLVARARLLSAARAKGGDGR